MDTKMKKQIVPVALGAIALAFAGCTTDAHYIDPDGKKTIVSLNTVDIQDFTMAANSLIEQMLKSYAFEGRSAKPRVALSRVKNDTTRNFDVNLLTDKVQQKILESGRATVTMSLGVEEENDVVRGKMGALGEKKTVLPDLSLLGKIAEVSARAGSTKQVSYVFSLRLADTHTGDVVWMGEKTVTKQGERNAVGW